MSEQLSAQTKVLERPGRIAGAPVEISASVTVEFSVNERILKMKSSKGEMVFQVHPSVLVKHEAEQISFLPLEGVEGSKAQAGTARAIANNMMLGLTNGFEKKLLLVGVGYKVKLQGKILVLSLGYSHDIKFELPAGITAESPSQTEIIIRGFDKQKVGQVSANIRSFRPPSPYKGKGVRYHDEVVKLKEVNK